MDSLLFLIKKGQQQENKSRLQWQTVLHDVY